MADGLYLEDLHVGQRHSSPSVSVTAEDIMRFARDFDPQPFHTDPDEAKRSFFGALVASGWHTAALTMKLLVHGGSPFSHGSIGTRCDISWPKPVYPGDNLRLETEILEILPPPRDKPFGRVKFLVTTLNQHGETVQKMTAILIVFSRGQAAKALTDL